MNIDLKILMPLACAWVDEQQSIICTSGLSLSEELTSLASKVGVIEPYKVRVLAVESILLPQNLILKRACEATGLITKSTIGLTLFHGIFIRKDEINNHKLLAHEFVHVAQYEKLGGINEFLTKYLGEVLAYGYPHAPMEIEAKRAESAILV